MQYRSSKKTAQFCSRARIHFIVAAIILSTVYTFPQLALADGPMVFPLSSKSLKLLKSDILKDKAELKAHRAVCKDKKLVSRTPYCDADHDGLVNKREKILGTSKLLKDTDFDGLDDFNEVVKNNSNPLVPDNFDGGCYPLIFDSQGNTTKLEIPAGLIGNTKVGQASYTKSCNVCHASGEKGTNYSFSELKTRLAQAPMFITALKDSQLAHITAYLNRVKSGEGMCHGNETPSPSPTGTPVVIPVGCSNQFFDSTGATTPGSFGITPSSLSGSMNAGSKYYATNCLSCHGEKGTGFTFAKLKAAVTGPLMKINNVSEQAYADMTSYLNRASAPTNCPNSPSPTGTATMAPSQTPTAGPTATITPPMCSNQFFDTKGNTAPNAFGITPSTLIGNMTTGATYYASNCTTCHGDRGAGFTFAQLQAAVTGPLMNIKTVTAQQYADMTAYMNRASAPANCGTPTPVVTATPKPTATQIANPTPTITPPMCSNQFFTTTGNTTPNAFGITPSTLSGNMSTGAAFYAANCTTCHGDRGAGFTFSQLKTAVTGPLMNIKTVTAQQYADMTAYMNRASAPANCGTPTPIPTATPIPPVTATPTPAPTAAPPGCSNQFFDTSGNTTSFGIPSPLIGNLSTGSGFYNSACTTCHGDRGAGFTFAQVKAAVTGPLMNIKTLTDQQYAHLTAYMNRASAPVNCPGATPTPIPTPLPDKDAGKLIYQTVCQSCHPTVNGDLRQLTSNKLKSAIRDEREMRTIKLTDEQIRVLLIYLHNPF